MELKAPELVDRSGEQCQETSWCPVVQFSDPQLLPSSLGPLHQAEEKGRAIMLAICYSCQELYRNYIVEAGREAREVEQPASQHTMGLGAGAAPSRVSPPMEPLC